MTYKQRKRLERVLAKKAEIALTFAKKLVTAVGIAFVLLGMGYFVVASFLEGENIIPAIVIAVEMVFMAFTGFDFSLEDEDEEEDEY